MDAPKRILAAGSFACGESSTSWQRVKAMEELGYDVVFVDTTPSKAIAGDRKLISRILCRFLRIRFDWGGVTQQMEQEIANSHFDGLWIDKGTNLKLSLFRLFKERFPEGKVIGYSPDDMMVPVNRSRRFVNSLPHYDHYFTTKSFHVAELSQLGCERVHFVDNAYDADLHRPVPVTDEDRSRLGHSVIFVGAYEEERAGFIRFLAENGISVRVWGDARWGLVDDPPSLMMLECKPVFSDDYAKAICASDISLCFLRKLNRDLQTTRSIEIPACQTMMIAERTDEHLALFADGREAVFFDTKEELLERVRYYLKNADEREAIAAAGRRRCIESGYSNLDRMRSMLDIAFAKKRIA